MSNADRDQALEAVTDAMFASPMLRARFSGVELLTEANLIRRDVARRLSPVPAVAVSDLNPEPSDHAE